jgi:hypothetical protein
MAQRMELRHQPGPIVLLVENHRTGLAWRLMRRCGYLRAGLRHAGFAGGWLD